MEVATSRQQEILDYISEQGRLNIIPSYREIARHFHCSFSTISDHVRLLKKKRLLTSQRGKARSFQVASALREPRSNVAAIPVLGTVPAGFGDSRKQENDACIIIDISTLGFTPSPSAFALQVTGESMIGRHIMPGDIAILEPGTPPKLNDVVAALIDQESTLKTYTVENGTPCLKAENPLFPNLYPLSELLVQGVVRFLFRKKL